MLKYFSLKFRLESVSCDKASRKQPQSVRDSSFLIPHTNIANLTFSDNWEVKVVQIRDVRTTPVPLTTALVIVVVPHNDVMLWFTMNMITMQHSIISSCGWASVKRARFSYYCTCRIDTKCYGHPPNWTFNNGVVLVLLLFYALC